MCISKLAKFKPTKEGIGYKWVAKIKRSFYSPTKNTHFKYRVDGWNIAEDTAISTDDYGFHIYDRLEDARKSFLAEHWEKNMVLFKVRYRDYKVAYGDGSLSCDSTRVIVAKKMKLLKEIK